MKNELLFLVIKYLGIILDKRLAIQKQYYESAVDFRNIEKSMIKEIEEYLEDEILLNKLIEEDCLYLVDDLFLSNAILSNSVFTHKKIIFDEFDKKTINISNYISKILGYDVENVIEADGATIVLRDFKLKLLCDEAKSKNEE